MLAGIWERWLTDHESRIRALERRSGATIPEAAKGAAWKVGIGLAALGYARLSTGSWPEARAVSQLLGLE